MQSAHACAVQTHFLVFSKVIQKASQNGVPRHPKSHKIKKNGHSKKHWKTRLQKVGSGSHFDLKKGMPLSPGNVSKITKIQDIVNMGLQVSQHSQKSSKNEPPGFQNHSKSWESGNPKSRNLITQNQKNPEKKTSSFQEIKMRHGGGLCAQRTG